MHFFLNQVQKDKLIVYRGKSKIGTSRIQAHWQLLQYCRQRVNTERRTATVTWVSNNPHSQKFFQLLPVPEDWNH